jgi:hypothetical protein
MYDIYELNEICRVLCTLKKEKNGGSLGMAGDILFAVAEFLGIGSQVPLLLVIDAI